MSFTHPVPLSLHSTEVGRLGSAPTRTRRTRRSSAPWSACSTCSSRRSSGNKSSVKRFPRHRSGAFRSTSPGRVYRSGWLARTWSAFQFLPRQWIGTISRSWSDRIWLQRLAVRSWPCDQPHSDRNKLCIPIQASQLVEQLVLLKRRRTVTHL